MENTYIHDKQKGINLKISFFTLSILMIIISFLLIRSNETLGIIISLSLLIIIPTMLRVLFNPNPFKLFNWENFFFPTAEGLFVLLGISLALINFAMNSKTRKVYIAFALTLFIYACTLTLVGHTALLSRDLGYGLLSAGDDMFRKKLPFMLIIYTMISYTFSTFKYRLRIN